MKKKALAIFMAGVLTFGLAACGSSSSTGSSAESAAPAESTAAGSDAAESTAAESSAADAAAEDVDYGSGNITIWVAEEVPAFTQTQAEQFLQDNPAYSGYTVTVEAVGEGDAASNMITDVEGGADIYGFAQDQLARLVSAGAVMEVIGDYADFVSTSNDSGAVSAATMGDSIYAFPVTSDNGYFLYYDSSVISAEDAQTVDGILAAAAAAGRTFDMTLNDGWYIYSFFAGAGLEATLADDGVNTVCNWNEAPGADVAQAVMDIASNSAFVSAPDADIVSGIKNGTVCAAVSGTWNAKVAQETWGENYAATKLPTYTLGGEQVQMGSFAGYKLVGVNPHSANVGVAMMLADYITNEANQQKRFEDRQLGPSNINVNASDAVQSAPAIAALAAQSDFADLQRVGANYWDPAASLGQILQSGDTQGKTTQQLVDDAVAGITAPVAQ
mgnify:CR=1 FL=1